jgi:hypothetical protein
VSEAAGNLLDHLAEENDEGLERTYQDLVSTLSGLLGRDE